MMTGFFKTKDRDIAKAFLWLLNECKRILRLLWDGCKMTVRLMCNEYMITGLINIKDCIIAEI